MVGLAQAAAATEPQKPCWWPVGALRLTRLLPYYKMMFLIPMRGVAVIAPTWKSETGNQSLGRPNSRGALMSIKLSTGFRCLARYVTASRFYF